ncbi:unnamed protein product [Oppiella nova]|uniref:Uncharacterized protein n=1 Tax=Oppiella nova TaxID=334625 RepID=A0A7R9LEF9_9ACAR|nr:unnamed protein product [Oppiella nova]CAG2162004.1 unnamed protein product [Oppiella nova]
MNRTTPKKRSTRSTPKKASKATPKKSSATNTTPKRTPSKRNAKPLPKSPISESMRQMTISEFFRPLASQPIVKNETIVSSLRNRHLRVEPMARTKPESIETNTRTTRRSKRSKELTISPIFGAQKRHSPANATKTTKKVKIMDESLPNDSLYKTCDELIDITADDDTHYVTAQELQQLDESCEQMSNSVDNNLTEDNSKASQKSNSKKCSQKKTSEKTQILNERKDNTTTGCDGDSDDELIPVFKRLEVVDQKCENVCKENYGKYVDKERQKKMNYILKNFSRLQRDKEMLDIQAVDEIDKQFAEVMESPQKDNRLDDCVKPPEDFYQILSRISSDLRAISDEQNGDENRVRRQLTNKELKTLSNAIKLMTRILNNSSLKLEDIDTEEELIQLLIILSRVHWKQLKNEDIYVIIQLISQSMEFPNDLVVYKETISQILSTLSCEINSFVAKASDLECNDIHKSLMILRTIVNVSTKRY